MKAIRWRLEERDFGFRFKSAKGKRLNKLYQGAKHNASYIVPSGQRKLALVRLNEPGSKASAPETFDIVPNPGQSYERDWDWIETEDGLCLNYAGCLDREEINRREDEGVGRAME